MCLAESKRRFAPVLFIAQSGQTKKICCIKMTKLNFNNKKFSLIENSEQGTVNSDTIFEYKQDKELVTAEYYGGSIKYGKIIAVLNKNKLDMRYQCVTSDNELKTGKAIAQVSISENGKIKLKLNLEWLEGKNEKGISEYIEN